MTAHPSPNRLTRLTRLTCTARCACALAALCALVAFATPRAALAEQHVAAQDLFALALPQGWAIKTTWQDPAASIFQVQGAAYGVDATLYVIHLDNHPDRTAAKIAETFQQVEVVSGRKPLPAPTLKDVHPSCPLTLTQTQDDTSRVVLVWCQHPSAPLLYLWRMEVPPPLLERADSLALNLWRYAAANFVILDPKTQQALGPLPLGLTLPPPAPSPAPTPAPTDPTAPPPTPTPAPAPTPP